MQQIAVTVSYKSSEVAEMGDRGASDSFYDFGAI